MPDLFQYSVVTLLLLSCFYFCNTTCQITRGKALTVPGNNNIHLTDGSQHYFHISSEFITRHPLLKIGSSEELARFFVTVIDTLPVTQSCRTNINITMPSMPKLFGNRTASLLFCYGRNKSYTFWAPGNLSMNFKAANRTPVELQIRRFLKQNTRGECENTTDYHCGASCFWRDVICDGVKHCSDRSDEKGCGLIVYQYSSSNYTYKRKKANDRRHCDLTGPSHPPEKGHKKAWCWYVVAYSTGIIASTVITSLVSGFCFMPPYDLDDDDEDDHRRDTGGGEMRHLDPVLDHPPSYEDVMNMDLSMPIHGHAIPKQQTAESP